MDSHEPSCEWVREHLEVLVDDDVDSTPAERVALEHHVAACDACARELAWARRVRDELRAMAFASVSTAVVEQAERQIRAASPAVVPLRPPVRRFRRAFIVAAAAIVIVAVTVADQRRRAAREVAVEEAAREAAVAFTYLGKYTRRAGEIVESEVIEQRLLLPVGKAMQRSGVTETKSSSGQS